MLTRDQLLEKMLVEQGVKDRARLEAQHYGPQGQMLAQQPPIIIMPAQPAAARQGGGWTIAAAIAGVVLAGGIAWGALTGYLGIEALTTDQQPVATQAAAPTTIARQSAVVRQAVPAGEQPAAPMVAVTSAPLQADYAAVIQAQAPHAIRGSSVPQVGSQDAPTAQPIVVQPVVRPTVALPTATPRLAATSAPRSEQYAANIRAQAPHKVR